MGGGISDLTGLKKRMVAVEILQRWGKSITEEGEITVVKAEGGVVDEVIAYLRGRQRMERGGWYIFFF